MNPKEQGSHASEMFRGEVMSEAARSMYAESAPLFANVIKKYIPVDGEYSLADLGSHKGKFLRELLDSLPGYTFHSIAVDVNDDDLLENSAEVKIHSDLMRMDIPDKSVDVVVCRYVLAWNNLKSQSDIISEIKRVGRKIAIIQHQGAVSDNPNPLQIASEELFGGIVPALKRSEFFFSTPRQIEHILEEQGIEFERVQDRKVSGLSELLVEKYELPGADAENVKRILRDTDYVNQTTWVLKF